MAEERFNEQQFLLDFIHYFENTVPNPDVDFSNESQEDIINRTGVIPVAYDHIMVVDGNPNVSFNQLVGKNNSSVMNMISPEQLSLLVPKIEIYKNVEWSDGTIVAVQYPINVPTTEASILASIEQRGNDVSLESIEWEDTGKDTSFAGITLSGRMNFVFQSFESFFMWRPSAWSGTAGAPTNRPSNTADICFGQLTTNAPGGGKDSYDIPALDANAPFPIKIIVGYSAPSDPQAELFDPWMIEQIGKMHTILHVATNKADYSFDDSGQMKVSMRFTGRFETAMLTSKYDLFHTDPGDKGNAFFKMQAKLTREAKSKMKEDLEERKKTLATNATPTRDLTVEETRITQAEEAIYLIENQTLEAAWGKMLGIINQSVVGQGKSQGDDADRRRMFTLTILPEAVQEYLLIKQQSKLASKQFTKKILSEEKFKEFQQKRDRRMKVFEKKIGWLDDNKAETAAFQLQTNKFKNPEEWKKAKGEAEKIFTSQEGVTCVVDGTVYRKINFFFLGDLIDAALRIIIKRPQTSEDECGDRIIGGNKNQNSKKMYQEARVILGSLILQHPTTKEITYKNLADIPVSLTAFKKFWYETVWATRKTNWVLKDFLKEVCTKLVINAAAPSYYGSAEVIAQNQMRISRIPFVAGGKMDKIWGNPQKNKAGYRKRISTTDLEAARNVRGTDDQNPVTNTVEYLYLHTKGAAPVNDTEKSTTSFNSINNIPHFYVGNNIGPVKKISFKRTSIPNRLEHSILQNKNNVRSQFLEADRFDPQITLFGSPFYLPGMKIYVDPTSLGLGHQAAGVRPKFDTKAQEMRRGDAGNTEWAVKLGLGGYCTVIKVRNEIVNGIYETKLEAVSEIGLQVKKTVREGGTVEEKIGQG